MPRESAIQWVTSKNSSTYGFVQTDSAHYLRIGIVDDAGHYTDWVVVPRRVARLLAKRINECLDATQ